MYTSNNIFMSVSDKKTFKLLAFLLLFLIVGDSLAIFDSFEPTRFGPSSMTAYRECGDEVDMQIPGSESEQNPTSPDPCFLCSCCVSGVSVSFFTNSIQQPFIAILAPDSFLLTGISENYIFHPPKYLS